MAYSCYASDMKIQSDYLLDDKIHLVTYSGTTFPVIAYVIKIPLNSVTMALIPAIGQRECVSSIAKRSKAFIAINGSNYRRGGNYNGNRVNFCYLNKHLNTDLKLIRGSFGWNSTTGTAAIDTIFLDLNFTIEGIKFSVDAVNQPRISGQSVLYNDSADRSLMAYTPGITIVINKEKVITSISQEIPATIPVGGLVYQIDTFPNTIKVGMQAVYHFNICAANTKCLYNDYDFILGGAGLLIHNGELQVEQLYDEFSQGTEIVHCGDEVAADFHTRQMQEWLITLRHPRTAIGLTDQNEICIVVVDGRQRHSEGFTLPELASFMQQLNCTNALNIGGGGCTTLCINGQLINSPSASFEKPIAGEDRPVSEALCFFRN